MDKPPAPDSPLKSLLATPLQRQTSSGSGSVPLIKMQNVSRCFLKGFVLVFFKCVIWVVRFAGSTTVQHGHAGTDADRAARSHQLRSR